MKRLAKHFYLLITLCALVAIIHGAETESFILKLWPDGIPGAKPSVSYKEEIIYRDNDRTRPRISKVTEPTLEVFLPQKGRENGTAVVICPGGGYSVLAYSHEGIQVAQWFRDRGVIGIVLKYRLPSDEIMQNRSVGPLQDVQEAIRTVRRHAKEWNVNPAKVGVIGFSAGGHLAGTATTLYSRTVYQNTDGTSARPDFSILVYGVLSMRREITHIGSRENLLGANASEESEIGYSSEANVTAQTPPCFLVHSMDDKAVPVENSLRFHAAMLKNGIPGELHIYEKGGHGYGLGVNPNSPSQWPDALAAWLKSRHLL